METTSGEGESVLTKQLNPEQGYIIRIRKAQARGFNPDSKIRESVPEQVRFKWKHER